MVKFRNIEEGVLRAVQLGDEDNKTLPDADDTDSGDEDEGDDEREVEMDEGQAAQAVTFEIDPDIDINSKALKDMVATDKTSINSSPLPLPPTAATTEASNTTPDWDW